MATNPCKSIRLADGLLPGDTRRDRKRSGFAITSGDNFQATLIIWFYKVIHGVNATVKFCIACRPQIIILEHFHVES